MLVERSIELNKLHSGVGYPASQPDERVMVSAASSLNIYRNEGGPWRRLMRQTVIVSQGRRTRTLIGCRLAPKRPAGDCGSPD